jgi:small subunit ribosomal protein S18
MAETKGRPVSASQRPTGGDKAIAVGRKQYFRRKKMCRFCSTDLDID